MPKNNLRNSIVLSSLLCLIVFMVELITPRGVSESTLYVIVILASLQSKNRRFVVMMIMICISLTILGYFLSPESIELWKSAVNRSFAIFAIVAVGLIGLQGFKAEESLRESEERYHSVLDNMMEGAQIIGFDWRFLYVNESVAKQGQQKIENFLGRTMMEVFPNVERTYLFSVLNNCMQERTSYQMENKITFPDGRIGWFEINIQPVEEGLFILSNDITKRKQAEERYRDVLDTMLEGCHIIGFDWCYLYVNKAGARLGRQESKSLIGKTMMEAYPDIEHSSLFPALKNCIELRKSAWVETEFFYPDGTSGWFQFSIQPVEEGIFILTIEITARKQAEKAFQKLNLELEQHIKERTNELKTTNEQLQDELVFRKQIETDLRQSETRYRALFEQSNDAVFLLDFQGNHITVNQHAAEMLGYTVEEIQHLSYADLSAEATKSEQVMKRLIAGEQVPVFERLFRKKNGEVFPVEINVELVRDDLGNPIHIQSVVRDITQRRQAEEALREAETKYRTLVENMPAVVYLNQFDSAVHSGRPVYISPQLEIILGYSPQEFIENPALWPSLLHPEDRERALAEDAWHFETGEPLRHEYRIFARDGRMIWLSDEATIIRDKANKPMFTQGVLLDITARRRAEQVVLQQNKMLSDLHTITLDLLKQKDLQLLLNSIVELSTRFLDAEYGELMLIEEEELVVQAITPNQKQLLGERVGRKEAFISWKAFETHQPVILSDYSQSEHRRDIYGQIPLHAIADFPILNNEECIGVLAFGRSQPNYEFTEDQIQFGKLFASLAALVLNNAQLRETLREQSIRDWLTGLFNRRYMEEALKQEISRAARQNHPLGIIMLDIDHFKKLNDSFGHLAGDSLLSQLGQFLQTNIRTEDIACRYGGEEFLLIMPNVSLETVKKRAELLREGISKQEKITISIGIAMYPQYGTNIESLIRSADTALYQAKQNGRNRVEVAVEISN